MQCENRMNECIEEKEMERRYVDLSLLMFMRQVGQSDCRIVLHHSRRCHSHVTCTRSHMPFSFCRQGIESLTGVCQLSYLEYFVSLNSSMPRPRIVCNSAMHDTRG